MEKITFIQSDKHRYASQLGIPDEREIDLKAHISKSMIRIGDRLQKSGNIGFDSIDILKEFISVAENENELVFLSMQAGFKIKEIKHVQDKILPQGMQEILSSLEEFRNHFKS